MRKLKKFKRYDEGGAVGAGSGDSFSYTDFSDRARNLKKPSEAAEIDDSRERYASTSASGMMNPSLRPGQGRRRDDDAEKPAETAPVARPRINNATPAETASVVKPTVRDSAKDTAQTSFDYPAQRESKRDDYEGGASPTSGGQTFRRAAPKAGPAKAGPASSSDQRRRPTEYERELEERERRLKSEKIAAASSKPSYVGAGDSDDSVDTKKKNELERLKRVGSGAVEQTMMGPAEIALFGAMGGIPSKVRAGLGLARKAYDEFTKPAAKPAEKSEPKLESKPEPKQGQLFDEAGQPTPAALGKPTPKEAPKAEPKAETKSGAIQPTGKGPSEAGRKLMQESGRGRPQTMKEKAIEEVNASRAATKDPRGPVSTETKSGAIQPTGKGPSEAGRKLMENANRPAGPQRPSLKEQALDAVNKQRAADKDPRGPVSGAIQPTGRGPSEAGSKLMREAGGNKPKGPERLPLKEQAKEAINAQRARDNDPRGPITEGSRSARPARPEPKPIKPTGAGPSEAGKKLMERVNNRSSTILEKERNPDLMMQEYISGRDAVRTRARDLPDDGLSTTRYANKKGGKIPAFKKGGLVGRGDGCAMRGKTKGRMV